MNKKSVFFTVLLVTFLSLSFAAATVNDPDLEGVNFTHPNAGEWYSGSIPVDWTNNQVWENLFLKYKEGNCEPEGNWLPLDDNIPATQLSFLWNYLPSDGEYCLRLQTSEEYSTTGIFCIDNTDPEVLLCTDTSCCKGPGVESDTLVHWDPDTSTMISLGFSDEVWPDTQSETCDTCEPVCTIYWGDGETDSCLDPSICSDNGWIDGIHKYTCFHQYRDNGIYSVNVEVEDCAGNVGDRTDTVEVTNVDPVCDGITGPSDVAVGQIVEFNGDATDVNADLPLIFSWNFGDSSTTVLGDGTGHSSVTHTYTTEGVYTVNLVVSDKDGGVSSETCSLQIDVVDPIVLPDQEVAAFYPLVADFGLGPNNQFEHDISGPEDCQKIAGPDNLVVDDDGAGYCKIWWDRDHIANPTNDERGTHMVVVKVTNGVDYEYYTFDITVWSWIIDLEEGWNFVSIPLVPETSNSIENVFLNQLGPSGQNILPDSGEYVVWSYQYNPCAECGENSRWLKSKRTGEGDLDTVMPGYGYWIKASDSGKIRGMGTQINQNPLFPGLPPSVVVAANGWSTIGRFGIIGTDSWDFGDGRVHGLLPYLDALESVRKWNNELHLRDVDSLGHLVTVTEMYNNQGYWLYVENEEDNSESEVYTPIDDYYEHN